MKENVKASGRVVFALGNLLKVAFEGRVTQGEVAVVRIRGGFLKAEVIEVEGSIAKIQVFEDTSGVQLDTPVEFSDELLEIELGPGLLGEIFDGLQNPLEKVALRTGLFLERGVYIPALDREKVWLFNPSANPGDTVRRGDTLGTTRESHFDHRIMVPFKLYGTYTVESIEKAGSYTIDKTVAILKNEVGERFEVQMLQKWPIKFPLIEGNKMRPEEMMTTGMRIIDTMIPIAKGGTGCNPGPFGAGKTVTQQIVAKYSNVDIVVLTACGERAGEVVEVLKTFPELQDVFTNEPLMHRTTIICNTSSMPVAARESSVYVGMTIGEYYRQMGLDVLVLADSTSRWAQAMREMSGRLEEIPGEEAFPAYLASRIAAFYERAGLVLLRDGKKGSLTVIVAVSPSGGNIMGDPVSRATMSIVGAFICLSREYSDARRYPAIDPLKSWSKYRSIAARTLSEKESDWGEWIKKADSILARGEEVGRRMEVVGQEGTSMDDYLTYLLSELFSFSYLQQNGFDKEDVYASIDKQVEMFKLINTVFAVPFQFEDKDKAKTFFLELQNKIKNLNYVPQSSEPYMKMYEEVMHTIDRARVEIGG
ncbi:MAG: V-type ATP synthase subunit A [Chlamydiae bacterium RIFCSPHIGHO2_12_FULL_49_11]|nr:MAG: V-type ATP synthase subunit A [Chlamydiae bacterium RIFCSPHIGHO2_12_FULL_49_11]